MAKTPPVPTDNQSPYPIAEAPHAETESATDGGGVAEQASATLQGGVSAARDAAGPLIEKARTFARERPWTAAALIGTIGLAVINTLRGKRP